MVKKRIIIISIMIAVLISILMVLKYTQYIMVWQANPKINVDGILLMMTENEIKSLLGKEEEYIPGFGGYFLKYPGKGVSLTFLDDMDTDFYHKVNKIEITNEKYEIFDVKVGDDYENAINSIRNHGFRKQIEGFSGYWKNNMYIVLEKDYDQVKSIAIGVNDRVSSTRVY